MAGERSRLPSNTFHQVTVGAHRVDVEIENVVARSIEPRGEPFTRDRHANAVAHTLPQWAGSSLNSAGDVRLGVSRRPAPQLPELFDLIHRYREFVGNVSLIVDLPHFRQIQQGV